MKRSITTLEELEKEQEKLKMMMELTRQEFARNIGTNRKQLQSYLLKRVVLPVGAVGLGIAAVNKMSSQKDEKQTVIKTQDNNLWKVFLPLGVNLFQTYFIKKQNDKINNVAEEVVEEDVSSSNYRTVT